MTNWNKNIYRSLIISSFLGIVLLILFGIGKTLSYLNTGADRSSMLHLALDKAQVYLPKVIWSDTINPGRPIEKQTLLDIEKDYLNAWYVRQVAYQTNLTSGIDDYYTISAQQNLIKNLEVNKQENISIKGTTTNHNLALDFYSADGQLAVLTDKNVKEYQQIYQKNQLLLETEIQSNYQVMLLLEDGFWRIRHLVKEKTQTSKEILQTDGFVKVIGTKIYVDNQEFQIKGINYYPQKTPWDMFGDDFNTHVISKDFDIIKTMGLNTIRIFLQYEDFGKASVKNEKLHKLEQVLDLAEAKDLKVIVTLFDFYGDYSVLDWTLTHRHAEQITTAFTNHRAILAWDVKNEPNLDFESRGKENVVAWLREMILQIKQYDSNHLVTIGWSDITSGGILKDEVDFVSFHYYQDIDIFEETYKELNSKINKPLVLQEFGVSSNREFWNPFGTSEKKQAAYHEQFQKIIQEQDIHYLSWTLYDFEEVPESVVGNLPWRKHKQKHFGFIDKAGKKKKAFEFTGN
ncbi:cellulase family glycosylhydrolase [uncultured Aquimarina sp.]|uniref:cellulase family glycosylhydrolase n=1 Tax=uncultured Aquimarina sp. TaxID=575652 RepID=UPI00260200C3|nr:cellulase family glycosylhydrolase [uncultured Aquimarina sp.]